MKISIASEGKDLEGEVSLRAGRAPYYLIFQDGRLLEVLKNPFAVGGGGAGFAVAKMLSDKGVEFVIAGKIGGNMGAALDERKMRFKEGRGKIKNFINNLK